MEFLLLLYAKSSIALAFNAVLSAEFSNQILQESGDFLEVVTENKYEGEFGKILGITPP